MAKFDFFAKDTRVNRLKNKFVTIDYVTDLNNLAKFGFGKIFGDWGTYTQHMFVFFFFFSIFTLLGTGRYSLNG